MLTAIKNIFEIFSKVHERGAKTCTNTVNLTQSGGVIKLPLIKTCQWPSWHLKAILPQSSCREGCAIIISVQQKGDDSITEQKNVLGDIIASISFELCVN